MKSRILIDTGPLVAVLSKGDQHHEECAELLRQILPPLVTCWPVLTEACWLLRSAPTAIDRLLISCASGLLSILPLTEQDAPSIAGILSRYQALRPRLADAALVHLAAREKIDTVFTLDQRDFRVYRLPGNRLFRLLPSR